VEPRQRHAPGGAVFFVVALLCGYFAEQLRSTHEQLREREGALERLRELTHQIVTSMGSGLLTVDREDGVSFVNETGERLLGISAAEATGRKLPELLPAIRNAPESRSRPSRLELQYDHPGGDSLSLGCAFSDLKGAPGGRILIFQDLTDVKAAEERARRNERLAAVGELSAGMAHEIRNPMAAIRGSIELLSKELHLTDYQDRLMEIVMREADRLNRLLTEFLQFARPQEIKSRPIAIADLLGETAEVFLQEEASRRPLEVQMDVPPNLFAEGDPEQVRQVAWNLLLNAREAMPGGGVIRVSAGEAKGPDPGLSQEFGGEFRNSRSNTGPSGWVELCFEDEGAGIPEKHLHRLFEPFFTTKENGTGLGLATVYRIVEAHGGSILAENAGGKGARFSLRLPRSTYTGKG
ncbi:MAG: nitrogen regulation protein NR(II), partial [Myxococcota bacterium]